MVNVSFNPCNQHIFQTHSSWLGCFWLSRWWWRYHNIEQRLLWWVHQPTEAATASRIGHVPCLLVQGLPKDFSHFLSCLRCSTFVGGANGLCSCGVYRWQDTMPEIPSTRLSYHQVAWQEGLVYKKPLRVVAINTLQFTLPSYLISWS